MLRTLSDHTPLGLMCATGGADYILSISGIGPATTLSVSGAGALLHESPVLVQA